MPHIDHQTTTESATWGSPMDMDTNKLHGMLDELFSTWARMQ